MECKWVEYNFDRGFKHGEQSKADVLIGCPVQKRDWIIGEWFWKTMAAAKIAGVKPAFIFVMDPSEKPLHTIIMNQARMHNSTLIIGEIVEENREDKREWNSIRYEKMVELRNLLLEGVRNFNPELFLSLDSDILLHELALKSMIENIGEYDAIGGKTYMTHTGKEFPSFGLLNGSRMIRRFDMETVIKVDVIMAIKLMKQSAYSQDYKVDTQGEDIGFSKNCADAGLRFGWDGTCASKHVMRQQDLDKVDSRVGF